MVSASQGTCVMSTPSNAFLESFKIDLPTTRQTFILMRLRWQSHFSVFLSLMKHSDTLLMVRAPPLHTMCQGQLMGSFICCLSGKLGPPPTIALFTCICSNFNAKFYHEEKKQTYVDGHVTISVTIYFHTHFGLASHNIAPTAFSPLPQSPQLDRIYT